MEDDELIKDLSKNEEEGIIKTLDEEESLDIKKKLILGSIIIVLALVIIIIILVPKKGKKSSSQSDNKTSIIRCLYQIETTKTPTELLSKEFTQTSGISLYINGNKQSTISEYQFERLGETEVNFTIPNNINMKNMFKDVKNLKSINLISENNGKIISMESTFEKCVNLENFEINGFNTLQIKSLKKIFYGTDLSKIDVVKFLDNFNTTNVEDMSYMFAYSQVKELDLSKLVTSNLKDISNMFQGTNFLTSINNKFQN